jgi:sporadic carbohydrate cluster 2OG-Fe(II) oxygenase
MPVMSSFFLDSEIALSRDFLAAGYVIRPMQDKAALDALRLEIAKIACGHLGAPVPADIHGFMDHIHDVLPVAQLNDLRLATYRRMNEVAWFRPTYFALARTILETLVGNELAMQNRVNLSVQYPDDDSSLLDIHTDTYGGETPFQVVQWLPLVDSHRTKSMFILPREKSERIHARLAEFQHGGMAAIFDAAKDDLIWLDIPYGSVLVFSPNCLHGNVVNRTRETRWSLNCRFTGLFTPYTSEHKKIGSYYLPITTRPVSRVGMAYRQPEGFEE